MTKPILGNDSTGRWILGAIFAIAMTLFGIWNKGLEKSIDVNRADIGDSEEKISKIDNRLTKIETQLEFIIEKQWGNAEYDRYERRQRPSHDTDRGDK